MNWRLRRRPECRDSKCWRFATHSLLILVSVCLIGCGEVTPVAKAEPTPAEAPRLNVPSIEFGDKTNIALVHHGQTLLVGDAIDKAFEVFPAPPKSYDFYELPKGLGKGYRARGWDAGGESFGVIAFGGRVALAMRTVDNCPPERRDEILRDAENQVVAQGRFLGGKYANYWFWERERQRMMICTVRNARGVSSLVWAIGDAELMSALRMDPTDAGIDLNKAERMFAGNDAGH